MKPAYMYSITSPAAIAAYLAFSAKCEEIGSNAKVFANKFVKEGQTAKPVFYAEAKSLAGVVFSPAHDDDVIWTRPDRNGTQVPRATPKKLKGVPLTAEQVAEHKVIRDMWNETFPRDGADINDVIELVTGVSNRFFLAATLTTISDTELLIVMSEPAKKTENVRELTGSEYAMIHATAKTK